MPARAAFDGPLRSRGRTGDGKLIRIRVAAMTNAPPFGGFLGIGRVIFTVAS